MYRLLALIISVFLLSSCADKQTITFSSTERGSIELVPLNNISSVAEKLGDMPKTVDATKLKGKAARIAALGKSPQYWVLTEPPTSRTEIKIKLFPPVDSGATQEVGKNRLFRLALKAYQALSSNDFRLAHDLTTKLSELDPTLAAPHIISGIAFIQQGKRVEARTALNKAKALDPEDTEIVELLKTIP